MAQSFDPFMILGIAKGAEQSDIDDAYEKLKRALQPSVDAGHPGARAQFQQAEAAYEQLRSPSARTKAAKKFKNTQKTDTGLAVRLTPSKRVIEHLPEPQVIYLLVEILPRTRPGVTFQKRDAGLNLALVLDYSNSMRGIRLDRVKVAASEIIEQLSANDYLSVVGFNDRAETIIPATTVTDKKTLSSRARMMRASGGTEIYRGLSAGVKELRKNLHPTRVNHLILLTDGNTYGDEDKCLRLAERVAKDGISISTLGLGSEWNDEFLDEIASATGGSSGFIKSANSVVSFLNTQVQSLSNIFAERVQMSLAPLPKVDLEMAFKLSPSSQPLSAETDIYQLGGIQFDRSIGVLYQLQIPADFPIGNQKLARVVVTGDIMADQHTQTAVGDVMIDVSKDAVIEDPPNKILDALGKLTLYRMQERAQQSLERGDIREATQQLQNFATRLFEVGQEDLAQQAYTEVKRLEKTQSLSNEAKKTLKYQTRSLINSDGDL